MRLIDADYLKTWFGEKDLYTYDYIIGTIDDAPTVKPEPKLLAEVKIDKEDLEDLVAEKVEEIKETMSGKWIPYSKVYECRYECSSCGYHLIGIHESEANFCPNCGADMRGDSE